MTDIEAAPGDVATMSRIRGIIAQRMRDSLQATAQLTAMVEADLSGVMAARREYANLLDGREGPAAAALRPADSASPTRRLLDASQDVIIREEDCQTERGLTKVIAAEGKNGKLVPAPPRPRSPAAFTSSASCSGWTVSAARGAE